MGDAGVRGDDHHRLSGGDPRHAPSGDGAGAQLALLRSDARWRPAAVAAPLLVLRPSGGLHHLPARSGADVDDGVRIVAHTAGGLSAYRARAGGDRSEEHTSELQSLMRTSYAV